VARYSKLYLPLSDAKESPDVKGRPQIPVTGGSETVLVAEDDVSLRDFTRIMLESFGYTVITANDGEDAIVTFLENRERIGIVLLDMIMPEEKRERGVEAIRKASPGIKILFESGYAQDIVNSKGIDGGRFLTSSTSLFCRKTF